MPYRPKSRKKQGRTERRKYRGKEYKTSEWRRYSEQFRRDNPECAACGTTEGTTHLDHIIPVSDGGAMWDVRQFQTLCISCHSRKTKREQDNPLPYRYNVDSEKIPLSNYKANRDSLRDDNKNSI